MGRISNFTLDTSVEESDKLLGSNNNGATKNFQVGDIAKFLANTNAAGSAGQIVYSYEAQESQKSTGSFLGTFSSGSTFAIGVRENNFQGKGVQLETNITITEESLKGKFSESP